MGCSESKNNSSATLERPGAMAAGNTKLKVWGDYFNADTRTILSILNIAGVAHDIQEVDMFKGDHKKEFYIQQNPSGQIPMLTEGGFKILGGNNIFLLYLCNSHQRIKDKLYPNEARNEIEKHLAWFQSRMKPTSTRLVKMIVHPKAFGEKAPSDQELNRETEEFFRKLLPSLDKQLEKKEFFCSDEITIADIQYYCEISTILKITKRELSDGDFPNLALWYNDRLSQIPEIQQLDAKLNEVLVNYNF